MTKCILAIALVAMSQLCFGAWPSDDFQKRLDIDIQNLGQHYAQYTIRPTGPKDCWADRTLTVTYAGSGEWGQDDGDDERCIGKLFLPPNPPLTLELTEAEIRNYGGNARLAHDDHDDFGTAPYMDLTHYNYCTPDACADPCNTGSCNFFMLAASYTVHAHKNADPNPHGPGHE